MLGLLRRSVKSWVARVLLGLLIASFAVWGIGDIFTGSSNTTIALVGKTEVEAEFFARAIQRQQNRMQRERGELVPLATLRQAGIDRAALARLVRDAAYTEELGGFGIAVPPGAVRDAIRANRAFQDGQGGFSQLAYSQVLGQQGFSPQEYEALMTALLGQQIIADAIGQGKGALPGAAEAIAKWQGEKRAVSALALTPDMAPEPAEPSDSALQTFFEADTARFMEPERRWGSYLRVDPAKIAEGMVPGEDEVRAEYDAKIETYSKPPSRTVEQIHFADAAKAADAAKRLAEGTVTWEEIAAEQNVALENLALGTVSEGDLPESSSKAVFALTEPGIAGPVATLSGQALLNVTAVEDGSVTPFEEVRETLSAAMARRRAVETVPRRANEIDEVRAGGATMAEIAGKTGLELVGFAGLAADGTVAEGEAPALAADQRFTAEVQAAVDGEERNIIELSDGGYALVMIDRIADRHLPELATIRDRVAAAWALEQRLVALEATAAELLIGAGAGDLTAIAAELEAEPIDFPAAVRTAMRPMMPPALVEQIFAGAEGDMVIGRSRGEGSVMIVRIAAVEPLKGDVLAQSVEAADKMLASSVASDQIEFYGRAIEDRHGIYINTDVVDAVFERLGQSRGGL